MTVGVKSQTKKHRQLKKIEKKVEEKIKKN
jgi:hypothetical protein